MTMPHGWPPFHPYAQSLALVGDDQTRTFFPSSLQGRHAGTYRPGVDPDTTVTAVAGDDGKPIGEARLQDVADLLSELIREVRSLRLGLVMAENNVCEDIDPQSMSDDNDPWL